MRNLDAPEYFESFLIAAIATILGIRVFLHVTGYPAIGGESLHIAHMLWGGVLMLVALVLLLGWLGSPARSAAAVIGGVGWGSFIDELGKFLTRDNDYFFEPAFALIYVSFVVLYVAFDALHVRRVVTREEVLANALELMQEAVRSDMDESEQRRAVDLLDHCDPMDPVVRSLSRALAQVELAQPGRAGPMRRAKNAVRAGYAWLVQRHWFKTAVVLFFVAHSVNAIFQSLLIVRQLTASLVLLIGGLLLAGLLLRPDSPDRVTRIGLPGAIAVLGAALLAGAAIAHRVLPELSFMQWAELTSSVVPALFVLLGIARLRRSRLQAYRTFKTAILLIIFVTQFFTFYHQQLLAVLGLALNIVIWVTLRAMIQEEERLARADHAPAIETVRE
ncbi:MAG TPA: hypothetical protein VFZ24_01420 [Longimicrobiales bacterium]